MTGMVVHTIRATALLACLITNVACVADVGIVTVLTGLANPCGIAIRPADASGGYDVFIADSGNGRIVRFPSNEPKNFAIALNGFHFTPLGDGGFPVGPIGLHFLDRNHLVVGLSGKEAGACLRLYELSDESLPMSADDAKQEVMLADKHEGASERNHIYAFARTLVTEKVSDGLLFTAFANDQSGDVRRVAVRAGTLGKIEHLIRAERTPFAGIAIGERGYVAVASVGSLNMPRDSRLAFYSPLDGSRRMELSTNLFDILGLAYGPKSGNLYAVDAAWMDPGQGGVFRIDDASGPGSTKCTTVRLADVLRPSALAFGPDGALYVTAFGEIDSNKPDQGMVVRIFGDL